ncbi:MAG: error-prone DNA polymerase, partial [Pseudomonadota bacterium]|nr:error-prone DNA polymerase [Pseudomonadota bacterium]
ELVEHELSLINELNYEGFFLTVENIVSFAKSRGILCQGRGSAANSAVCYCLGITEVDPSTMDMLFERFISKERDEPPDIDVDFEHERREEVIQYVYSYYGRNYAALGATVIRYKRKSAVRDVGKALGYGANEFGVLLKNKKKLELGASKEFAHKVVEEHSEFSKIDMFYAMVREIIGFPRHLSQHVGGFVISDNEISHMVPIENASMPGRTVIQWDKNDLEILGILKFDCLALGMLTVIRKSFDLLGHFEGRRYEISDIPSEDKRTYSMIQKADTLGVFQIESRAQMAMLPRLKPECFYDLVIEIAIIRPGPIQGDMVHPYLRRRRGEEEISYPSDEIRRVLKRTLGVPLFQEQVIKLAVVAAGFSPGEAEVLRRSITSWNRENVIGKFHKRLVKGMMVRGYKKEFAENIFNQIKGFGEYGFPESHAASFALLAYVSSWLKCHKQAAFTAALLNSQPMGFYSPSQLIRDAVAHDVEVRPFDIKKSEWDSTLEMDESGKAAIRLGLRLIKGLEKKYVDQLLQVRKRKVFNNIHEFRKLSFNSTDKVVTLAYAGALNSLVGSNRFYAVWESILPNEGKIFDKYASLKEAIPMLRPPTESEDVIIDYATSHFSLGCHPVKFIREQASFKSYLTAGDLHTLKSGSVVNVIGLVISRQRPQTAAGVIFITLEDESGLINLIIWPSVVKAFEDTLIGAKILSVRGKLQKDGIVVHIVAQNMSDHTSEIENINISSRDFR